LSGECAAGSNRRAIDGKIFEAAGGAEIPCLVRWYFIPVQEYSVHHGIGFCKPTNAVTFHLPPGLSLRIPKARSRRRARLKSNLSKGQTTAINRVACGEVPAAVLALLSPEAAQAFPEIAGFRIFRVPLSPCALTGRPNTQ
jgi:hypothetical protein